MGVPQELLDKQEGLKMDSERVHHSPLPGLHTKTTLSPRSTGHPMGSQVESLGLGALPTSPSL